MSSEWVRVDCLQKSYPHNVFSSKPLTVIDRYIFDNDKLPLQFLTKNSKYAQIASTPTNVTFV